MHWTAAGAAVEERREWVAVPRPRFARLAQVARADVGARLPGRLVHECRMLALDQLTIDHELASIHRVVEDVLDHVASEDDGRRAVVVGLVGTTDWSHPFVVQVLGERADA